MIEQNQVALSSNGRYSVSSGNVKLTKKDILEGFRINEDDYAYIILNIIPEIESRFIGLIKKYFNFKLDELIGDDVDNVKVCYGMYVDEYTPSELKKHTSNFNIANNSVLDLIHYSGRDIDNYYTMMCKLNDDELFCVLQSFIVTLYQLGSFILGKQIKLNNIDPTYLNSQQLDDESLYFIKFMVEHDYFEIPIKRLDLLSDINKFFKLKNLVCINMSKVRGKDDILRLLISKIFRMMFYDVLVDFNRQNSIEEAIDRCNSITILEDLYKYFYSKVFINNDIVATESVEETIINNESDSNEKTLFNESDVLSEEYIVVEKEDQHEYQLEE